MAETVFSGVTGDTGVQGTLFQGIKFWISHKVPQRSRFLSDVKVNGGEILPLEKHADVRIVDHARKEAPPGSHSYTFIEKSIRNGALEDLDDHKVGPPEGNIRSIGSVVQPAKGTRNKYTEADDRILWNWVNENPQKGGGTDGNEIYKQLEKRHPQHPWQSWRDRWIRHLKGTVAPFPLPHNAPPTPPSDISATIEATKNRPATSDTAEDEYPPFSDDDAEALMVNGKHLLVLHPNNITEAWESWTRDHDKDGVHTAQQWQSYWEESVRPRYSRRKAKQTRRASPEKTIPTRSQVSVSPKSTVDGPLSAISPLKEKHSLMPALPQKTVFKSHDLTLPKRSAAALPSTFSPDFKSQSSLVLGSSKEIGSSIDQNPISPKRSVAIPSSGLSPSDKNDHHSLKSAARSPCYHPDLPTMTATAQSNIQQTTNIHSTHMPSFPSSNERHTPMTPEKSRLSNRETLKRKHVAIDDEDLPSSSPIGPISPKRRWPSGSGLPVEIASTPEKRRQPNIEEPSSPLYIKLELEEDEPNLAAQFYENESPLGQQLFDTLSEPGHIVSNTQALFGNANPLVDFDVPVPEGGWDNDEPLVQNSSQPESFDIPLAEDSGEDNKRNIREFTQLVDFDLVPHEGGWDEQDAEIEEESKSPSTEIYDPQPTLPDTPLPDTQAIFQSKTPAPDFSMPEPDGGWSSLIVSSPPLMPSSPRAESIFSQTELKDQMDAWIDAHAVKGISVEQVESVLKSTSMDTALASKALRRLAKKGALPENWKGVWTESDDEDLKSTDARKIQRLQEKHGADCLTARWEFLDFYAEGA